MDCPSCAKAFDLPAWLDNVGTITPAKKWLWARCPGCGGSQEIRLEKGRALMGYVDGGPGMVFIPLKSYDQPGLVARWEGRRAYVSYQGRTWTLRV